jgi:hypothetical protein
VVADSTPKVDQVTSICNEVWYDSWSEYFVDGRVLVFMFLALRSYSHGTRGVDGREPMMSSDEKPPAYFLKEAVSKFVHCGGRGLPDVNRIQLNGV